MSALPDMTNLQDTAPGGLLSEADLRPRVIQCSRPWWRRAWHAVARQLRIAILRYNIWANEQWKRACAADGIMGTRSLVELDKITQELRVELALELQS